MSYSDNTSPSEAKELLRKWRESNERRSEEVIDLWVSELGAYHNENLNALGNDSKYPETTALAEGEPQDSLTPNTSATQPETSESVEGPIAETQTRTNGEEVANLRAPVKVKKKLCGAARKRYRRMIEADMWAEDALALCQKPWNEIIAEKPMLSKVGKQNTPKVEYPRKQKPVQIPFEKPPPPPLSKTVKRIRSVEEAPREPPKKTARHTEVDKPYYRMVAGAPRVGIRNTNPMSEDQMHQVHRALLVEIMKTGKGEGPRFAGFAHKTGWILVNCENQNSQDWLVSTIGGIKPWPGAELTVIPESELPKAQVGTTFLPKGEVDSIQEALTLLRTQNEGLNTELWRVLHTRVDEAGSLVTLAFDDPSVEVLKAQQFKAVLGFKKITFRIKDVIKGLDDPEHVPGHAPTKPSATISDEPRPSASRRPIAPVPMPVGRGQWQRSTGQWQEGSRGRGRGSNNWGGKRGAVAGRGRSRPPLKRAGAYYSAPYF